MGLSGLTSLFEQVCEWHWRNDTTGFMYRVIPQTPPIKYNEIMSRLQLFGYHH